MTRPTHHVRFAGRLFLLLVILLSPAARAASPRLNLITPRGVQRGADRELTFHGSRLGDTQEVFFYQPGLEVKEITKAEDGQVTVNVAVSADCRLGEHVAQLRTATGITDYRIFCVGDRPEVNETEPNSEFDAPEAVTPGCTINGTIENEDVDYFVVSLVKGQRLSAEVQALKLGGPLFDPYLAIIDQRRFELAAADDTPLFGQDSAVSIVAPEDGQYVIQVRDSAYGGGGNHRYRLHVGHFPRPTAVFPAGGPAGTEMTVRWLGDPNGEFEQAIILPTEVDRPFDLRSSDDQGTTPSAMDFRVTSEPNTLELEPNNGPDTATLAERGTSLNGIVQDAGDRDMFKVTAQQGEVLDIECYARRLGSPLDPVIHVRHVNKKHAAGNDDSRGLDGYLRYTFPEEGEYLIDVHDKLNRGGPDFVYRFELTSVQPRLSLGIPRLERNGQYRQTVFVPRGNRFATLLTASRSDIGGEVVLDASQLPQGLSMVAEAMPANANVMPVVFEAAADAPVDGELVSFTGHIPRDEDHVRGVFENQADMVLGPPNNRAYLQRHVNQLAMAVVEEAPFHLELVQPNVPLVRNGSMQLKIVATRAEGFTAPINVQLPFRPPGLGTTPSVTIGEGATEIPYPVNANGNAETRSWPIYAIGSADAGGAVWVSTQLAQLEISEPFATFQIERVGCEQGETAQAICTVQQHKPFEGTAKVELLGLPPHVSTTVQELTKDTEQLVFDLQTTAESPVGKHKSPFCQLTITIADEPIVARAGGFELQIDAPLPSTAPPQPRPEQVAVEEPPKTKPLTRLQKLRLEAKNLNQ